MHIDNLPPAILPGRWIDEHTPGVLKLVPSARYYALNYGAKRAFAAVPCHMESRSRTAHARKFRSQDGGEVSRRSAAAVSRSYANLASGAGTGRTGLVDVPRSRHWQDYQSLAQTTGRHDAKQNSMGSTEEEAWRARR